MGIGKGFCRLPCNSYFTTLVPLLVFFVLSLAKLVLQSVEPGACTVWLSGVPVGVSFREAHHAKENQCYGRVQLGKPCHPSCIFNLILAYSRDAHTSNQCCFRSDKCLVFRKKHTPGQTQSKFGLRRRTAKLGPDTEEITSHPACKNKGALITGRPATRGGIRTGQDHSSTGLAKSSRIRLRGEHTKLDERSRIP